MMAADKKENEKAAVQSVQRRKCEEYANNFIKNFHRNKNEREV